MGGTLDLWRNTQPRRNGAATSGHHLWTRVLKMSAPTATILTFPAPKPAPERAQSAPGPVTTSRAQNDAEVYEFATALLREGFRLAMNHARVTVPELNRAGPLRRS
jgi:hypothetical protein